MLPVHNYLDVEFQEGKDVRRIRDRNRKRSSVAIFALTLEKTKVELQEVQKSRGNIFDKGNIFTIGLMGKAEEAGEYLLKYDVYTLEGKKILSNKRKEIFAKGEKRDISITDEIKEKGYFEIRTALSDASGKNTSVRNTAFVMLQDNTPQAHWSKSPYMVWLSGRT